VVNREVVGLGDRILRYVAMHPDAADSEVGILQWWLKDSDPTPTSQQLREALAHLVGAGLLARDRRADGVDLYSARVQTQ
jgi:hypothetical protein